MSTAFEEWKRQRKAAEGGTVQPAETAFERWKKQHKENERNYFTAVNNPEGTGVNAASWITQRNRERDGKTPTVTLPDKTPNEMSRSTSDITFRNQLRDAEADEKAAGAAYRETLKSGDQQARLDAGRAVGEANARKRAAQERVDANDAAATAYGYTVLRQNPDYDSLSKPDAELMERGRKAPDFSGFLGSRGTNINLYYNVNSKDRDAIRIDVNSAPGSVGEYAYMTDEEAANFNYLFKKQGAEAARAYYDQLVPELNRRRTERAEALWAQRAQDTPVRADVARIGMNLVGGVAGIADLTAQNVQRYLTRSDEPVDYNTGAMLGSRLAQTIQETRAQDIAEKHPKALGGANIASFLYQTGMSMADSAVVAGLTLLGVPGATALLGGSAAAQSAREVKERGGTDAQALGYGLAAGIAESLFEAISLDKIIQPTARGLAAGLRNVLRQAFTEGSEEVATTLANTLSDRLINGDTNALGLDIRRYQELGYSDRDAAKKALVGWLQGLAGDFLGGVISGFGMSGGRVAATNLVGGVQDARTAAAQTRQERAAQNANPAQGASDAAALTPLDRALRTLESGETLSGQSVRRVMEDADSMERLRDSGALTETVRPGAEGRRQVADAVEAYRDMQDTPAAENAQNAAQNAPDGNTNLLTQTVRNDTMRETGEAPGMEGANANEGAEAADGGLLRTAGGIEARSVEDGTGAGRRSERQNRVGTGGQNSETFLESLRGARKQRERQRSIRYALEALRLNKISTAAIGVENGTENATLSVLPDTPMDAQTEKLLEEIGFRRMQRAFARDGITVRGFIGTLEFADGRGVHTARGWTSADGRTVYVALDHPVLRYDQILMHEHFHVQVKRSRTFLRDVAAKFDAQFTEAERRAIVNDYMDAYGFYDVSEDYVLEEVLADYYGGIDIFAGTEDAQADFEQRRAAVTRAAREAAQSGQTRTEEDAGQEKYSADRRSDRPERRRALRPGEMANEFRDRINWREYYAKIAQNEYTPDYFEDGETAIVELSDGTAIVEMQRNGEWQVIQYGGINDEGRTQKRDGVSEVSEERNYDGSRSGKAIRESGRTGSQNAGKGTAELSSEGNRKGSAARDPEASGDGLSAERERKASRDANGGKTSGEKFSMEAPVEEVGKLLALHNMTENNLRGALELGGLPMPSIAVVRADTGHTKYGPISVVFDKSSIDPRASSLNKVYGSDAWTPTAPQIGYKYSDRAISSMRSKVESIIGADLYRELNPSLDSSNINDKVLRSNGSFAEAYRDSVALKLAYLKEIGKQISVPTMQRKYSAPTAVLKQLAKTIDVEALREMPYEEKIKYEPQVRQALYDYELNRPEYQSVTDNGKTIAQVRAEVMYGKQLSYKTFQDAINDAASIKRYGVRKETDVNKLKARVDGLLKSKKAAADYDAWLSDLSDGLIEKKGIRNNKDPYTSVGNRRSFEALYDEYTLDNIVRAMRRQEERGGQIFGVNSKTLQSVTTPAYGSIAEIRQDSGRLGKLDEGQYEALNKEIDDDLMQAIDDIFNSTEHFDDNRFIEYDNIAEAVIKAARRGTAPEGIARSFARDGYRINRDIAETLSEIFKRTKTLPTEYFEAKPQRAVKFDEALAVVTPENSSKELLRELRAAGINVLTYETGNEADRLAKINSVEGARFSRDLDSRGEALSPQQAEYFRDSKVRDEQGRLKVMYHISDSGDIGVFQSGNSAGLIYFAETEKAARMGARGSKAAYRVYLNAVNPVNEKTAPVNWYDAEDSITVAEWKRNGYDGVYVKDESGVSFAVFSPEQIKRTDNENPTKDPDIRFSRNLPGDTAELQDEYDKLKEKLDYWKGQVKRTEVFTLREKDTRRLTKSILSGYSSKADAADIGARIKKLGEYLMKGDGDGVSWVEAHDDAVRIARDVIQNASALVEDGERETYRRMKAYFRSTSIKVTNAKNVIADYNEFRKRNFGKFILSDSGTPIDSMWEELQEMFGKGYFPDDTMTQEDQIYYVADLLDSLRDVYENPYQGNYAEAVEYCANEILDRLLSDEVRQTPKTFADKAEERLARQSIRYEDKLDRQAEQFEERYQRRVLKDEERYQYVRYLLDQERENRKAQLEELRRDHRSRDARAREKRRASELRGKISRHARELTTLLLKPNDKRHIPKGLEKPVAALLSAIDLSSGYVLEYGTDGGYHRVDAALSLGGEETKRTAAFRQIQEQLRRMAGEWADDGTLFGDAGEAGLLTTVIEDYADIPIAKMNSEQLQTVWDAVRAVEGAIRSMNRLFSTERWANQAELAAAIRRENRGKVKPVELTGLPGRTKKLAELDMLTPEAYFRRLGSVGDELFRLVRDAQDEEIRIKDAARAKTAEIMGDADVRELERELHTVTIGGETVQISTAQLMELYALSRRDQGLQHILTGGILIEETKNGLVRSVNTEPVRITQEELSDALSLLTLPQRRMAEQLQDYLSVDVAEVGNKASMNVYGYEKFGKEERYWPIRTNKNEVATEIGSDSRVTTPAQRGFTKAVKPDAKTSLKIGSIFDTYSRHIAEMSNYAAYLGITEDLNRIRNFNFKDENGISTGTVKGILNNVFGSGGAAYLENLLTDVSNGAGIDDSALTSGFFSNYKAAAIGANLRVILQQPTAILRAADMIDPKYLAIGLKNPMRAFEEAKKYAPIAVWKDWGYFDINTGRQMKDILFDNTSRLAKAKELSMSLAGKADSFAWGQLWNAVKAETRDKTGLDSGSSEFYQQVARRFTEIIDRTQVVDGILQRSQIMRSKNWLNKAATSFMSEPTKQYNMFMSAVYDARNGDAKAKKRLARTTAALLVSGIVNAVVQSIWDAVRDDDKDKEYWEKFLSAFIGYDSENDSFGNAIKAYFKSNVGAMLNPGSYIPYAKDIVSLLQGYDVSRMDMDAIDGTIKAAQSWVKSVDGEGKKTTAYTTVRLVENAAKLLGIPLYNIERDLTAIVDTIATATKSYPLQYRMYSAINRTPDSGKPNSDVTAMLYRAYMADNGDYEQITRMMEKDGYTADGIQDALEARWKQEHGVSDALKAANTDGGGYSQQDIVSAVNALKLPTETTDLILSMELGEKQGTKYAAARKMGISAKEYTEAVLSLPRFDADHNGNYSGGEVEAALKDMKGLSDRDRSILWQTLSSATSAKNNPFDMETGTEYLVTAAGAKLPELTLPTANSDATDFSKALSKPEAMNDEERLAAYGEIIGTEMMTESGKPTQWAKLNAAVKDGVSVKDAIQMAQENTLDDYMKWRDSDAKKAGIESDIYIRYRTETAKLSADKDKDGKSISGSKKKKVVAYIHRLKLTAKQKDALYLDAGYTEKDMGEAPWHTLSLPVA